MTMRREKKKLKRRKMRRGLEAQSPGPHQKDTAQATSRAVLMESFRQLQNRKKNHRKKRSSGGLEY
ncbi:unnamed protein product [Protopolystoma xenopodis]|uniref:Uncharacterized protein n=1 Tax=Protopolystoma xenopodis TaxID=117903 RepID=A0A448X3J2_9PLAT|nr:unnamed protein product [Protopolystoma xenopodis]